MKIGVIGAGYLGTIHIKLLKNLKEFQLIGFFDNNAKQANAIQKEFGVEHYKDAESLMDAVDVIDIVSPTVSHFEYAKKSLLKGKHVFIEKPVTSSVAQAEALIQIATQRCLKVQVGHVERFNPAFLAAKDFLDKPLFIETHRLAKFNPRETSVSVVLDLMIHDIDIVLSIVNSAVANISASGVAVVSESHDITNARIAFENGTVANLTASRVSLKNMRKTRVFQKNAYVSIDFLTKEAEVVRIRDGKSWSPFAVNFEVDNRGTQKSLTLKKPKIKDMNAIEEELKDFARCINENSIPIVSLQEATKALQVAQLVLDEITSKTP